MLFALVDPPVAPVRTLAPAESDGDLVELALLGDRRAEEQLYRRHLRGVVNTAARLLGSVRDAEDVAHDAFVRAFERLSSLKEPSAFGAWLLQIAVRLVHRRFRRQRLLRRLGIGTAGELEWSELVSEHASPERLAELQLVAAQLNQLAPGVRLAWMLRRVEGFSLRECAELAECSLATVKRRIAEADARVHALRDEVHP